jgi:3-oxoacyl-[acyl-carrier-protein] synthase II
VSWTERTVVTGMGVVSSLGTGVETFHRALMRGDSGISTLQTPKETGYKIVRAGVVKNFDLCDYVPEASHVGRASQLALAACKLALEQAGLNPGQHPDRVGTVVGTALGDALEFEEQWDSYRETKKAKNSRPYYEWMRLGSLKDRITETFGLGGSSHLVTTNCAAGNQAISWSSDLLKSGAADAMLAVAADTLGFVDVLGFCRLLLQAPERCQPFDLHRKGTILSEGSAALVLETVSSARRRGANILAEVAGHGESSDAAGAFASKLQDTRGMRVAFTRALRSAGVSADQIDHVSAHGSGTRLNDAKETIFLKQIFGQRAYKLPVNSIKSMLGHAQGAAPMLEAVACVLTLNRHCLYPTVNYETPDPACDLDYIANQPRHQRVDTILSNSFGVGGNNSLVIFRRWE